MHQQHPSYPCRQVPESALACLSVCGASTYIDLLRVRHLRQPGHPRAQPQQQQPRARLIALPSYSHKLPPHANILTHTQLFPVTESSRAKK